MLLVFHTEKMYRKKILSHAYELDKECCIFKVYSLESYVENVN